MPAGYHVSCVERDVDGQRTTDTGLFDQIVSLIQEARFGAMAVCEAYANDSMIQDDRSRELLDCLRTMILGQSVTNKEIRAIFQPLYSRILAPDSSLPFCRTTASDRFGHIERFNLGGASQASTATNSPTSTDIELDDSDDGLDAEREDEALRRWRQGVLEVLDQHDEQNLDKKLEELDPVKHDMIIIHCMHCDKPSADSVLTASKARAGLKKSSNVCRLYNGFFEGSAVRYFKDLEVRDKQTSADQHLRRLPSGMMMHEFAHSICAGGALDQVIQAAELLFIFRQPELDDFQWVKNKDGSRSKSLKCYKWDLCRTLAIQHSAANRPKLALANSSNLQFFTMLILMFWAYPEYDFSSGVARLRPDNELAHSNSAFNCLRHPSAKQIWELDGYKVSEDTWRQQYGDEKAPIEVVMARLGKKHEKE
ncbi:hypothetical protein PMZ80_001916 [Knufia obscura]|uniref:Uncharacterized protein n=1 Tax=Knufia obscura TaxID=1635080 RepID=A0ABR0RVS4_9EURO|nr:hypothetical protein PMZ80_001916 [Knufia obscura]